MAIHKVNIDVSLPSQRVFYAFDSNGSKLHIEDDDNNLDVRLANVDVGGLLDALTNTGTGMRSAVIAQGLRALAHDIDEYFADPKATELADLLCRLADLATREKHDDLAMIHAAIDAKGRP